MFIAQSSVETPAKKPEIVGTNPTVTVIDNIVPITRGVPEIGESNEPKTPV
jgi:hypothetical protein